MFYVYISGSNKCQLSSLKEIVNVHEKFIKLLNEYSIIHQINMASKLGMSVPT
jgi:hypothetical protein